MELDDPVDRFGTAVVRAFRGEVREERYPPASQCGSEASDLGDRAGVERADDLLGNPAPLGQVFLVIRGA